MTAQHQHQAGRDSRVVELYGTARTDMDHRSTPTNSDSFGSRLRKAREARRLDLESCAHALKLPARVLRHLENDEREGMDYAVYLGSYITKYARHLGLDEESIQAELNSIKRGSPALVVTGGISHSRYMLERYATAATYVVLTAVIVVPMIWLGVRGTLDRDMSHLAALDARPVAQQDAPVRNDSGHATNVTPGAQARTAVPPPVASANEQPLMASMAPFPDMVDKGPQPTAPAVTATTPSVDGASGHSLSLQLADSSWVEVVAADGSRLEYGLLPAGSSKTWHSDQPLDVRIGNASGARVSVDGQPVPLEGYRHANVAHFRVQVEDGKATPAGF
jgi:cytoskeleton protein RodZ